MRLLFMGTPEFAVPSLRRLVNSSHLVAGVVTVPDKPRGRGQQMAPSDIKKEAIKLGLDVWQPAKLDEPEFLNAVRSLRLDLIVVVAFRILPESCFTIPKYGSINLHASLLPKYRGAAPIQRAIMNGETETGVTTFFLKSRVDTGDMLLQDSLQIGPDETAGSVHDRLAELGAKVLVKTVDGIDSGELRSRPQDSSLATPAPKIQREDCVIRWQNGVEQVHNHIRALSPYPGAFTRWQDSQLKIFHGKISDRTSRQSQHAPGSVVHLSDNIIHVQCEDGIYGVTQLQPEGKRRMSSSDFLNGYPLQPGDQFV